MSNKKKQTWVEDPRYKKFFSSLQSGASLNLPAMAGDFGIDWEEVEGLLKTDARFEGEISKAIKKLRFTLINQLYLSAVEGKVPNSVRSINPVNVKTMISLIDSGAILSGKEDKEISVEQESKELEKYLGEIEEL